MSKIDEYVNDVMKYIAADSKIKSRIKDDLYLHLNEAVEHKSMEKAISDMGNPEEVAAEFMETIYQSDDHDINNLIEQKVNSILRKDYYEYKSKAKVFGIPLVHIKMRNRGRRLCVAKGIIAIGDISVGVISISAIPVGIISVGAASLGLISFGGMAIGLVAGFGGLAIGTLAYGGLAIGLGSIGGCAIGEIAIGGYAKGYVAVGDKVAGKFTLIRSHLGPGDGEAIRNIIKAGFPKLPEWIVNIFTFPFGK